MAFFARYKVTVALILMAFGGRTYGQVNIAAGGVTSHNADLNWAGYLWTSDKAVDGCDSAAIAANHGGNYEASRCCSCSNGVGQQSWSVVLTTPSVLSSIVIEGRSDITSQLVGFKVEIQPTGGAPPIQIYDNALAGDLVTSPIRIENLNTNFPFVIERVNVKKPVAPMTLCEVKVFAAVATTTNAPLTTTNAPLTTTLPPVATTTNAPLTTTNAPLTTTLPQTSVALGRPTEQLFTLNYVWFWSSDKAVDGCYERNDPNNFEYQCCATSDAIAGISNYWRVSLYTQYLVDKIEIYSRGDGNNQLSGFQVYGQLEAGWPEFLMYTDFTAYTSGYYSITFDPPALTSAVIVRRSNIITLCEVDVFGVPAQPATTTSLAPPTTTAAEATTVTTAPPTVQTTTQGMDIAFDRYIEAELL